MEGQLESGRSHACKPLQVMDLLATITGQVEPDIVGEQWDEQGNLMIASFAFPGPNLNPAEDRLPDQDDDMEHTEFDQRADAPRRRKSETMTTFAI